MAKNRIFSTDVLGKEELKEAISLKADTIVSNERICDIPPGIDYINSEVFRVPGTHEAYKYNNSIIDRLYSKFENKLAVNGISTRKAISKMVYWTNYKTGYLHACINALGKASEIVGIKPYLPGNIFRETTKYIRHYISNNLKYFLLQNIACNEEVNNRKIGLLVNDSFELGMFEYLVKTASPADLVIFHYGNIDFTQYPFVGPEIKTIDLNKIRHYSKQPFINPFSLRATETAVVNILVSNWHYISSEIMRYRYIAGTSVKSLIINVGENLPVRNLMTDIFGDTVKVYNTMNGIKSGEAHDGDVYFTKWFVWDDIMKRMLVEKCGVKEDMLSVSGHLMKDFVNEFTFKNTLEIEVARLENKKVISVFSVRGQREEKVETFKYVSGLIKNNPEYVLIIRPHPLENEGDYAFPDSPTPNIYFVRYDLKNSKQTLYDQIFISDIGIVFGSTVAMECQWMNVPAVTFEKRETSNIYCVDQVSIRHVRSVNDLRTILETLEKKKTMETRINTDSVARTIWRTIERDQYTSLSSSN